MLNTVDQVKQAVKVAAPTSTKGADDPLAALPSKLSRRFIRYMLGFTVSVGIGLAPYLGVVSVPLFEPLLNLIPHTVRDSLIPLSAAVMGIVTIVVQWHGTGQTVGRHALNRYFSRSLLVCGAALVALLVVHTLTVVRVETLGGKRAVSFIVGFSRPYRPPCPPDVSASDCIQRLSFDSAAIASFWGDRNVRLASLALQMSYLGFTTSIAALVGLLLLKEEAGRLTRPRRRR